MVGTAPLPAPGQPASGVNPKRKRGPRPKHVPQRTCIACRTTAPKRSFIRVVRTPAGSVVIDPTGKQSGRGASICGTRTCWERVMGGSLLERALRVTMSEEDRAALRRFTATLPDELETGEDQSAPASPGTTAAR